MNKISKTTEEVAYQTCIEAIEKKKRIEVHFWDLAETLYEIKENEMFLVNWDTWEDYCQEFHGMSVRSMDKLVQIYRTFVVENGVPIAELEKTGGWASLSETLPAIHTPEDAKQWVEKAQVLSLRDLRKEVKESRTGVLQAVCGHGKAYVIRVCPDCGDRERLYECPYCHLPLGNQTP